MKKYKVGFISGFFDILHEGHIQILREAKQQCEYLIVAVGTDEFMKERKNRESVLSYEARCQIVAAIRYVDKVVEETDLDKVAAYTKYRFNVMFSGDDHEYETTYLRDSMILKQVYGVDTIYIKRSGTSSSKIRKRVISMADCVSTNQ